MRRLDRQRRRKKIKFGIVIALLVLLVGWICLYPWRTERKKETGDNVVQTVMNKVWDTVKGREDNNASNAGSTSKDSTETSAEKTGTTAPAETPADSLETTDSTGVATNTTGTSVSTGATTNTTGTPDPMGAAANTTGTSDSTGATANTTETPATTSTSPDTAGAPTSSTSTNTPTQSASTSSTSQPTTASSQIQLTKAEQILEGMTLTDKIYQMMFVRPEAITGVQTVTAAGEMTRTALLKYPVGGIVYSKPNMLSKDQIKTVIANTQSYAKVPLFIATDEEGGIVNRLMDSVGTTKIDSMYTYKDNGTKTAENNAEIIATDMHALGFNLDFAPVADVWSNEYNSVIGKRAYSDDFQEAAELVGAAVNGFHKGGVLCTLKHFPGHGDTAEDTHTSTAYVRRSKDKLEKNEFLPFKSGIEAGADLVMVGHLIVEDIDDTTPASLSEKIVTGILRNELKFDGLIMTDSLEMAAVSNRYTAGEAAVNAIKAGNDILLEPENLDEAVQGILEAVGKGEITEVQLNEHVLRILEVKEAAGILA